MTATHHIDVRIMPGAPTDLSAERLALLADFALEAEGVDRPVGACLAIVDDCTIQELHARHMGIDTPTDVLTFELATTDFVSGETAPVLGDVIVSFETAEAQAGDVGHSVTREIEFLVLHGVLHLLGYNDAEDSVRTEMLARQDQLLTAFENGSAALGRARLPSPQAITIEYQ